MITELNPYPTYKPSGVEWQGDIPEHWDLMRMKTILNERVEKGFPDEPLLAATQTKGVVLKEKYENRTVLALKDLHQLKLVHVNDFVISLRSFQGGIEYARDQGIISPAYTILFPKQSEMHGYLACLFKSKPYIENLSFYVTGIRQGQNIDYEKLSRSKIPIPPLLEQTAIVRYLEYINWRTRRYINAKQKLIKLLEEEKQAVINHVVTRGLDPNVPLKDSGLEWLGEVPEHWEFLRLKNVFKKIIGGSTPSSNEPDFWDGDVVWITPTDVSKNTKLRTSLRRITDKGKKSCSLEIIPPGSLIVTSRAPVGNVAIAEVNLCTNQGCKSLLISRKILTFYGFHLLNSIKNEIQSIAKGTTFAEISKDKLGTIILPLPTISEQTNIVEYLDKATSEIDTVITKTRNEIALLHEYRTRLISDVVTGKLDVREVAANLPDESDETEYLDEPEIVSGDEADVIDDELDIDFDTKEAEV